MIVLLLTSIYSSVTCEASIEAFHSLDFLHRLSKVWPLELNCLFHQAVGFVLLSKAHLFSLQTEGNI